MAEDAGAADSGVDIGARLRRLRETHGRSQQRRVLGPGDADASNSRLPHRFRNIGSESVI